MLEGTQERILRVKVDLAMVGFLKPRVLSEARIDAVPLGAPWRCVKNDFLFQRSKSRLISFAQVLADRGPDYLKDADVVGLGSG